MFGGRLISLALFNVTQVEQARSVVRIELQALLKIFSGLVEAPQMAVREPHERIGTRGRIQFDQSFELFDGLFRFAGHEITFAESGVQIGALRSNFHAGFQQRNRVFEIILRHADAGEEKDDVRVFGGKLVGANQQVQSVDRFLLRGIDLRQQIKGFGRIGLQFQRAVQDEFRFRVFAALQIDLSEVVENLEGFRLQRVGFSSSSWAARYCFSAASNTPSVKCSCTFSLFCAESSCAAFKPSAVRAGLKIGARSELNASRDCLRADSLKIGNGFGRRCSWPSGPGPDCSWRRELAGSEAQDLAKLFFGEVEVLLERRKRSPGCCESGWTWDRASALAGMRSERSA